MRKRVGGSVLIPAPFGPHGLACVRSLSRNGVRTVVAAENQKDPTTASRYCDESVVVPSPYEDILAYKDALRSVAERPDVRLVVPNREVDVYVLSKFHEEFDPYVASLWPPLGTLRSVHDRLRLTEVAEKAGVPVPETWSLDDVDDWDRELIIKSRYNLLVDDYVDSFTTADSQRNTILKYLAPGDEPDPEAIYREMNHVPIVQECVPKKDEYLFGALYNHGEPVATFQHRQIRGETYAGGGGSYRVTVDIPELENVGRALLDHLDWHGLACIEFMEDANTGEFKLTEINPRMWRSLAVAVESGADFPYYYWLLANGDADRIEPEYDVGFGVHYLHGELTYLRSLIREDYANVERPSIWQTAWEIATSCIDQPHFDYLRRDDLGPFVRGVLDTVAIESDAFSAQD